LLAGLTANVIVVLLTAAVLNEVLQSRSRRRWRVLAQYVMFELAHNARMIWTGVLEVAGLRARQRRGGWPLGPGSCSTPTPTPRCQMPRACADRILEPELCL
jgi:hypothetical protein